MTTITKIFALATLFSGVVGTITAQTTNIKGDYSISNVDFTSVKLNDTFWTPRIRQNQEVTIPIALKQCISTGRIDNFKKAAAINQGKNIGWFATEYPFDDSDVFKVLEGMAYSIQNIPNKDLETQMEEIISYIVAAQEKDGYLYTARTAAEPGKLHGWIHQERWRNAPDLSHELYNMGHLYEAAAAHFKATGRHTLLNVATRNADLLVKDFLKGGLTYEPGHQIIESGLVKLYRITRKQEYLDLAKYFLDLRGNKGVARSEYAQTHLPVVQQKEAVGHAVRATYMYSGMADVAAITGNQDYLNAINTIWNNVVWKKYYITGGIGALGGGEAFGANYQLPNATAYCETCAAIANVYWNWRMFLMYGDSKYYDVLERTLYNGVLSGISLSGNRFFYPNVLESNGGKGRAEWFGCACCPSNMCRFVASVGGYIYAHTDNQIYVNLYAQGKASINLGKEQVELSQQTNYPWEGDINITIDKGLKKSKPFALAMRLPGWACSKPVPSDLYYYTSASTPAKIDIKVNGQSVEYTMKDGYMVIERKWKAGDNVSFFLPMETHFTHAHNDVANCIGRVSVERGPIVYCAEKIDNPEHFDGLIVNDGATSSVEWTDDMNGLNRMNLEATDYKTGSTFTLKAIPYYAWCNRGDKGMKVWFPNTADIYSNPLGTVNEADTIHLKLTMEPRKDYTPNNRLMMQKQEVTNCLGVTEAEFDEMMGSKIIYAAINSDGSLNLESTATTPGHWFDSKSNSCGWATHDCKVASELHNEGSQIWLQICQLPNACKVGDTFTLRQCLTYRNGQKTSRVVFETKIDIRD